MTAYRVPVTNARTAETLEIEVSASSAVDAVRAAVIVAFRQHGWRSCHSHSDLVQPVVYTCLTCGRELVNREAYFCPPCLVWAMRQQMAPQEVA